MEDVDFVSSLQRAEKSLASIYPLMAERKPKQAIAAALETMEHIVRFIAFVVHNKAKG